MFYIEISIKPDFDKSIYNKWEILYNEKLHPFLKNKNMGVSFPEYSCSDNYLGNKIRIFSKDDYKLYDLYNNYLNNKKYLNLFKISNVKKVPEEIKGYALFYRLKPEKSLKRIVRRRAKRIGLSEFEVLNKYYYSFKIEDTKCPYIKMYSSSTKQHFSLFIKKEISEKKFDNCSFDSYGLGKKVPIF